MKSGNKNLIIAGAAGAAVYFLFPQVQEFLVGGEFSAGGSGTTGFNNSKGTDESKTQNAAVTEEGTIIEGVLTKKQLSFITSNLDTSLGESTLNTYSYDSGASASILSTNVGNEKALTSDIGLFAGSNTLFTYTNKKGQVVGGSDFKNLQSVTAERAARDSSNPESFITTDYNKRSSSGGGSSSKKSNKVSISTAKDSVVRDYENKNLVSTTKSASQIKSENNFSKLISSKKEDKKQSSSSFISSLFRRS